MYRNTLFFLIFLLSLSATVASAQDSLVLSAGSGSPGSIVTLPLTLTAPTSPASLQWTVTYSTTDFSALTVTAGAAATAASKTISCSSTTGTVICVAYGVNANVLSSGVVANLNLTIAAGTAATSSAVQITGAIGAASDSSAITTTSTGSTVTIVQPPPIPSSLSCAPATVAGGQPSTCTVRLNKAAPAGGFAVSLSSNNTAVVTVPSSVTVASGATSATFTATSIAPGVATSVTVTATGGGGSANFSVTVNPPTYTLTLTAGTGGTIVASPSSSNGQYAYATPVTITATASPGYVFAGFSGDLSGTTNPQTITMTSSHAVTANFSVATTNYPLTLTAGTGGTIAANPPPTNGQYAPGTVVTITATPSTGYVFTGFSGDLTGSTNPQPITMSSAHSVTANFAAVYKLTLSAGAGGTVAANPAAPNGQYSYAAPVSITATPNPGYVFTGFTGDLSGTTNPQTITMTSDHQVVANFAPIYTLTLTAGTGGTVAANPPSANGQYAYAAVVSITATPSPGYVFAGFSGDLSGTVNPQSITMTSAHLVVANFAPSTANFPLTLTAGSGGTISVNPPSTNGQYAPNTVVTITATPSPGYAFANFSGDLTGSTNPQQITMTSAHSVTANFTPLYTLTLSAGTGGTVAANPPSADGQYPYPAVVTITATPSPGYVFSGFTGDLTGTTNPQAITMTSAHLVVANFAPAGSNYPLTLTAGTGGTITANPASTNGLYTPGTLVTVTATPSPGYVFTGFTGDLSGSTNPQTVTMSAARSITATFGAFAVNRTALNFGVRPGSTTPQQTVNLSIPAGVSWSTSTSGGNIQVSPVSSTGPATLQILATGGSNGTITINSPGASPRTISIAVNTLPTPAAGPAGNPSNIAGVVDQPGATQTTGFAGAIAVTGWALDDIGVQKVSVYREPVPQDAAGSTVTVLGRALIYIGDAIFLPDTRPDVAQAYPHAPQNYRAGWGMLVLSNTMPNNNGTAGAGGNGTYKFHIVSTSVEGYQYELGARTVTVDNAHSPLPFGTIDTPTQGEQVAITSQYVNFGWALTAQPNSIPLDGSTMFVSLDGANAGRPTYGFPRADLDPLFPGYANSGKEVGYFYMDTTKLANGLHSIAWSVRDSGGNIQGIGSRVFYVNNPNAPVAGPASLVTGAKKALSLDTVAVRLGPDFEAPLTPVTAQDGVYQVAVKRGERVEIRFGQTLLDASAQTLPAGATVDAEAGVFYWQPPVMAYGDFAVQLATADGGFVNALIRIGGGVTE